MWEASADYKDGTSVLRYFEASEKSDSDQQQELEEWLMNRHDGCIRYSVNWIYE